MLFFFFCLKGNIKRTLFVQQECRRNVSCLQAERKDQSYVTRALNTHTHTHQPGKSPWVLSDVRKMFHCARHLLVAESREETKHMETKEFIYLYFISIYQ